MEIEESAMHFAQHTVPDIQIKHKFQKIYWMIDVKCPYNSPPNMSKRDEWMSRILVHSQWGLPQPIGI